MADSDKFVFENEDSDDQMAEEEERHHHHLGCKRHLG